MFWGALRDARWHLDLRNFEALCHAAQSALEQFLYMRRRKSATPPADFLRFKKKIIMNISDTLMRNISALAWDTDSYLITVLWVGASENASRSAGPRLDALLVPFLLTNKKHAIMLSMCCLKTSNMITDLWREQNEEQQCGSCCSLAGD